VGDEGLSRVVATKKLEAILPKARRRANVMSRNSSISVFEMASAHMIPPEREAAVVKAMRALGYRCVKNQRLISRAAGD
jgi:hypothetical protein